MAGRLAPFIELGVGFNPELTARENVVLNGVMMGLGRREAQRRLDAVLEFAELEDFLELKLKNYSSGMLVRLAFATAIQADADRNQDAAQAMRTLPLVAGYLAGQMAAGRLRRMDPVLAMQALAGPIVMHLLMPASTHSQSGAGRGVTVPLEGVVDELVGIWLRAMTPGDQQQPTSTSREPA